MYKLKFSYRKSARLLSCLFILLIFSSFSAFSAEKFPYRYRYVSLSDKYPTGFNTFSPGMINDHAIVAGSVLNCNEIGECTDVHPANYLPNGTTKVLKHSGIGSLINNLGVIGGISDEGNSSQPALFLGDFIKKIIPIKLSENEIFADIISLNLFNTALIAIDFNTRYLLYKNGKVTPLNFGQTITNPNFVSYVTIGKFLNNQGVIAGTTSDIFGNARGFRFDTRNGNAKILEPIAPDKLAWGMGINNKDNVIGYSFGAPSIPYRERIGIWDKKGNFKIYFESGTSSNALVFNDNNQIVATLIGGDISYLIPKPGIRLNIADLVENLPSGVNIRYIYDINNPGDMLGFGSKGEVFLLQRIDGIYGYRFPKPKNKALAPTSTSQPIPKAVMGIMQQRIKQLKQRKQGTTLSKNLYPALN